MENSPKKSSQSRSRYQKDYTKLEAIFDAAVERSRKKKIIYYASDRLYSEDSRREMAKNSYKAVAWAEPLDEKDVHTEIIDLAKETRLEQVAPSSQEDKDQLSPASEKEALNEAPIKVKPESALMLYQRLKEQAQQQKASDQEEPKVEETVPEISETIEALPEDNETSTDTTEIEMESPTSDEMGFLERYYKTKQEVLGKLETQEEELEDETPDISDQESISNPEEDTELLGSLIDMITEPAEEEKEDEPEVFTLPVFNLEEEKQESDDTFVLPVFEKEENQSEPEETDSVSTDIFSWHPSEPETLESEEDLEETDTVSTDIFTWHPSEPETLESEEDLEETDEPVEDIGLSASEKDLEETDEHSSVQEETLSPLLDTEIIETESNGEAIPLSSLFENSAKETENLESKEDLPEDNETIEDISNPEDQDLLINIDLSESESEENDSHKLDEHDTVEDTKPLNLAEVSLPEPVEEPAKEVVTVEPKSEEETVQPEESKTAEKFPSELIVTGPQTYENVLKDVNVSRISLACVVAFFALFVILAYPDFLGFDYIGLVLTLVGIFIAWDMGSRNLVFMCLVMLITLIVCMMVWVYQTRIQVPMLHYIWFFLIPLCMGVSYSYINSKRLFDGFVKKTEVAVTPETTIISPKAPEKINLKTIINDIDDSNTALNSDEKTVEEESPEITILVNSVETEEEDRSSDTKEFKPVDLNLDDAPKWEYEAVIGDKPLNYDAPIEEYLEEEQKVKEAPDEKKIEIPSLSDFISVDQFGLSEEELQESIETQDTGSVVFGEIQEVSDPDDSDYSF